MSDLVGRLRAGCIDSSDCQAQKAADEIERLRAALQDIVHCVTHDYSRRDIQATALAALEGDDE
jgi:hypothetical protein